jgi:hypothetical protein
MVSFDRVRVPGSSHPNDFFQYEECLRYLISTIRKNSGRMGTATRSRIRCCLGWAVFPRRKFHIENARLRFVVSRYMAVSDGSFFFAGVGDCFPRGHEAESRERLGALRCIGSIIDDPMTV